MNEPAHPRVSKPVLILWGLVGLLVALGCGTPAKVSSTPAGTSVAATSPATSQATATATVMPDVVGKQLDVAKNDIKSAGFKDKVEIIGGGTLGVVVDGNWKVCAQSPEAGQALTGAPKLTVDRSCGGGATESTTIASAPSEPPTSAPANAATISKAEFDKITIGMSYESVVQIVGGPGNVQSEASIGGHSSKMVIWDSVCGVGNASAMFEDGALTAKADLLLC